MMDATKYAPGYYRVPASYDSWVKKDHIDSHLVQRGPARRQSGLSSHEPRGKSWNSSRCWSKLASRGSKSAGRQRDGYEFLRTLIEKNMIPDDVTVQVL